MRICNRFFALRKSSPLFSFSFRYGLLHTHSFGSWIDIDYSHQDSFRCFGSKAMYEPHRSLEPGAKRQEKTDLKEKLQPHPNERDKHVLTQEWRTVENTDYLYNVSDDETIHSSTSNPTAKVMSRRSGANLEEGHSGSRGSDQTLALTAGRVKQSVVKNTDNSLGTGDPSRKVTRSLKPPGREKAVTQTSLKTLSRPEDIPNDEHSLRQHPTRNRGGDLLLHAAPTGSIASTHVTPLVLKTKDWPIIIETAKVCPEAITTLIHTRC